MVPFSGSLCSIKGRTTNNAAPSTSNIHPFICGAAQLRREKIILINGEPITSDDWPAPKEGKAEGATRNALQGVAASVMKDITRNERFR